MINKYVCLFTGLDDSKSGISVTLGCSWNNTNYGCKFHANGDDPNLRKFKLSGSTLEEEENFAFNLESIATMVAPILKKCAPIAYNNMVQHEDMAE